jgi:hypothetical protein
MDYTGDMEGPVHVRTRFECWTYPNMNKSILAYMATYQNMPSCDMRDIHCKMNGKDSKLELQQPIKIPTKQSGPNSWVPGAKR